MRQVTKIEMETLADVEVHGVFSQKEGDYKEIKPKTAITAEMLEANLQNILCDICEDFGDVAKMIYDLKDRVEALEGKG